MAHKSFESTVILSSNVQPVHCSWFDTVSQNICCNVLMNFYEFHIYQAWLKPTKYLSQE